MLDIQPIVLRLSAMNEPSEPENFSALVNLCCRMGAGEDQAKVMARQLIKRSEQIAQERGVNRVEAMRELIELLIKGRNGTV